MRAKCLSDLLKKGDRVAISNITGREASKVCVESYEFCENIVGGWALGKSGKKIEVGDERIPVFSSFRELSLSIKKESLPNKIVVYSPPDAVFGEVKEVLNYGADFVETIFIITEHVSVEDTAKIYKICNSKGIDVVGCNTLGVINVHDGVRVGAVGGDSCKETFLPGSVAVFSNSGNMVNTISSYLQSVGLGVSFGVSTGKDSLILTSLKDLLELCANDDSTKLVVAYVEPGGVYEKEAIKMMKECSFNKPIIVYVAGRIAEKFSVSLGHAGAVVEGEETSASGKISLFDDYFGIDVFSPYKDYNKDYRLVNALAKGIRVDTLHHIPEAALLVTKMLDIQNDFEPKDSLELNPWFLNLNPLKGKVSEDLLLDVGKIPENYARQFEKTEVKEGSKIDVKENSQGLKIDEYFGARFTRESMRNKSNASFNDGKEPKVFGTSLVDLMKEKSFVESILLYWTGRLPQDDFETRLVEMTFIASLTNGPGTISAQGSKLSASAGNPPNVGMIGTLASIGDTHGGNGSKAVKFLLDIFASSGLKDPYDEQFEVKKSVQSFVEEFKQKKKKAKQEGFQTPTIPCVGHPVFKDDEINFDPRERVISNFLSENKKRNVFLDFYHELVKELKKSEVTKNVLCVNVDAAISCVWLGVCWSALCKKTMTKERAIDLPFVGFAIGRVAGGVGEYLDHRDYGKGMDMRIPTSQTKGNA